MTSNSSTHICFLAPNAYPVLADDAALQFAGGAELQQVLIARALVHRGYRVSMICLDFGQEDKCEVDGVVVHRAFRPDAGIPVLRFVSPRLTGIWRCLKEVGADIVYQRGAGMITGVLARYSRQYGARSIFAMAGETKIRFSRDRWLFHYGIRNVDRIVVQNTMQRDLVRTRFAREPVLIPNCFQSPEGGVEQQERGVLWVSTIRYIKRPHLFLDLAEALPEYEFTMVGGRDPMDSALYDEVQARASRLSNVRFEGFVPYSRVHKYFDEAALFVNTSESEGFPNTFLQAWSRGKPTVSFIDCGARMNGEQIGNTVSSMEDMIIAVRELNESPAKRAGLGELARQYVGLHHDTERVVDRYEELFRELLSPGTRLAKETGSIAR